MSSLNKIIAHVFTAMCFLLVLLHLFGPFGGPLFVWKYIERGFYELNLSLFELDTPMYDVVVYFNKLIALLFWICIITPLIIIFLRIPPNKRYNLILICLAIASVIVFVPKIINLLI